LKVLEKASKVLEKASKVLEKASKVLRPFIDPFENALKNI